jgi:hypothetical protein
MIVGRGDGGAKQQEIHGEFLARQARGLPHNFKQGDLIRVDDGGSYTGPDAMQRKRRNGRTSTRTSVEDEIAHLRGLDLKGLRSRYEYHRYFRLLRNGVLACLP